MIEFVIGGSARGKTGSELAIFHHSSAALLGTRTPVDCAPMPEDALGHAIECFILSITQ
jgi:hypothetical protein